MRAIVQTKRGKEFATMQVVQMPKAALQAGEIRLKMISSRVNPIDMDLMKGFPTLKYKNPQIGGVDGAGEVAEVGSGVANFKVGDKAMFYRLFSDIGAWAQEIVISEKFCAKIPESIDAFEAGAVALPLLTAYEAITALKPQKGEKILIHGAAGGVGFQAVQLCKALGLEIVATASKSAEEFLQKAGVSKIVDYKSEDFAKVLKDADVDYIFDVLGKETLLKSIGLKPKKVVSILLPDPSQMHKAGVKLPGVIGFIINLTNRKYIKLAKKESVELMGQVTGPSGQVMQKAIDLLSSAGYIKRELKVRTFDDIAENGLSKSDIGTVIAF